MSRSVIRTVRDVAVLLVLALLPALAGCASRGYSAPPAPAGPNAEAVAGPSSRGGMAYLVPPQSMPATHEELWVIQKAPSASGDEGGGAAPGTGSMVVPRGGRVVPVPLEHTDVRATIAGYVATVDVAQRFHNPFDGKIEAVYVFPLPHDAAVSEFVMTVGDRRIRGILREREEAKQIYEQAKRQGFVASLLEQDRPNVFTQKVADIEPGRRIDVSVRYFHTLEYRDGWYEWAFPMVVGPPGERSGHDIALAVHLNAGVRVEDVRCTTHPCDITRTDVADELFVHLAPADRIPNRDFVLRWKVAGAGVKSGLVVQKGKDGARYFAMTVLPPAELVALARSPVEMVFAVDVSGNMAGRPVEQAKGAVRAALNRLRPDDTLQVVRFAGGAEVMSDRPLPATPANVVAAAQFLERGGAGGRTMMPEAMKKVLGTPADESRRRYVVVLTGGYVGKEGEVLGALRKTLGDRRVFAVGVGPAPNRFLLEHMAKLGRGAVAYVGPNDNAGRVMAAFCDAVSHPAMTDLAIDWGGAGAAEVYPRRLPDVFVGRPVTVTGRWSGEPPRAVKVMGTVGGERRAVEVAVTEQPGAALAAVWARMKIGDLGDRLAAEPGDVGAARDVREVALEYGLMSSFTSFVTVDSMTRTKGERGRTVTTPVAGPEGVRDGTAVRE